MIHDIREATSADLDDVARLLDAAMLEFDRERVRRRIDDGDVLVAVVREHRTPTDIPESGSGLTHQEAETEGGNCGADGSEIPADRVVGVCVLEAVGRTSEADGDFAAVADVVGSDRPATEIVSIAVHRSRRGRGIGRALVEAAAARSAGPLVARFHEQVRPFYEALGFEIRAPVDETECNGASGNDGIDGGDTVDGDMGDGDDVSRDGESEDGNVDSGDDPVSGGDSVSGDDRLYGVLV